MYVGMSVCLLMLLNLIQIQISGAHYFVAQHCPHLQLNFIWVVSVNGSKWHVHTAYARVYVCAYLIWIYFHMYRHEVCLYMCVCVFTCNTMQPTHHQQLKAAQVCIKCEYVCLYVCKCVCGTVHQHLVGRTKIRKYLHIFHLTSCDLNSYAQSLWVGSWLVCWLAGWLAFGCWLLASWLLLLVVGCRLAVGGSQCENRWQFSASTTNRRRLRRSSA